MKVDNVKDILGVAYKYRQEYGRITISFFNEKKGIEQRKRWRKYIYSLKGDNVKFTKRNAIWDYLNGYIEYEVLEEIIRSR